MEPAGKRLASGAHLRKGLFQLTAVPGQQDAYSWSLRDILRIPGLWLQSSVQFNYHFDLEWLLHQCGYHCLEVAVSLTPWCRYPAPAQALPLTVVYGNADNLSGREAMPPNVSYFQAPHLRQYGTHHSKFMLLFYRGDTMRVVIHTANMVAKDWAFKTNGVWVSPLLPKAAPAATAAAADAARLSRVPFAADLDAVLASYGGAKSASGASLKAIREKVAEYDFSAIGERVRLVGTIPGTLSGPPMHEFGHLKVRKILTDAGIKAAPDAELVAQFSSIGSVQDKFLNEQLAISFNVGFAGPHRRIKIIYPSEENVRTSIEGYEGGFSLPHSAKYEQQHDFLRQSCYRWEASWCDRTRANPHIKTYGSVSAAHKTADWFLLTSANLSKAAWGTLEKNNTQCSAKSYELGILFLPPSPEHKLPLMAFHPDMDDALPVPYDLPLTKYAASDRMWFWDTDHPKPDSKHRIHVGGELLQVRSAPQQSDGSESEMDDDDVVISTPTNYSKQETELKSMGFTNLEAVRHALNKSHGDIAQAVHLLCSSH